MRRCPPSRLWPLSALPLSVWLLSAGLLSGSALAADGPSLDGAGRITVEGGWRLTTNHTFYDSFYALPKFQGLARAPQSPGGPFGAASFGYGVTENIELGIDLFLTSEQLRLTNAPSLTNTTYGGLIGVRFQTALDVLGATALVPFIGLATGPTLSLSTASGYGKRELANQTFVGTVGATLRLSSQWAITAEYRLAFARGQSAYLNNPDQTHDFDGLASYNSGGNWFGVGLTYLIAPTPNAHPLP